MSAAEITPSQVYRACVPAGGPRIRIVSYRPGNAHAWVADAETGLRPRWLLVTVLHTTATTGAGRPRRTGYVLESAPETMGAKRS